MALSRRQFIKRLAAASLLGGGTVGYTLYIEPHWVSFTRLTLPVKNLPDSLDGRLLVQISDLHIGRDVSERYLQNCFEAVRLLKPDIVICTGDFITLSKQVLKRAEKVLRSFPHGARATVAVLGNHDYGRGWAEADFAAKVQAIANGADIKILRNEIISIDGLQLAGLDDIWSGNCRPAELTRKLSPTEASLILSHNPDAVDREGWDSYKGWILSGHTHGGQCKPPFLPPPLLPVENRRYTAGRFDLTGDRTLYINRGLGHLLKARFNARPEITLFSLVRA